MKRGVEGRILETLIVSTNYIHSLNNLPVQGVAHGV